MRDVGMCGGVEMPSPPSISLLNYCAQKLASVWTFPHHGCQGARNPVSAPHGCTYPRPSGGRKASERQVQHSNHIVANRLMWRRKESPWLVSCGESIVWAVF